MHNADPCSDSKSTNIKLILDSIFFEKKSSPFIDLLLHALSDAGCPLKPEHHISIEDCDKRHNIIGAFDSFNNQIVLCRNRINQLQTSNKVTSVQQTLSHELIHAYDHCRADVDFYNNPAHMMCSEIRAAALSGECMFRKNFVEATLSGLKSYHQTCVKRTALASFRALHPQWNQDKSQMLLEKIFFNCYNDTSPFDRIPFSRRQAELSYESYKRQQRI